ncbi:MAG: hypothetical protein JXA49_03965 [Actinobacteria bacterium]|nr:hypothetical protein [Actinomycetota bacterium]
MKWIKRSVIAGIISGIMGGMAAGVAILAWLKPTVLELMTFRWYRDMPMKMIMKLLAALWPVLAYGWGEKGIQALQFVLYEGGKARGKLIREGLQIDPGDARSIGRILDLEDGMVGVKGTWTRESKGCAIKEERYCPAAKELEPCPQVCTHLMTAMEAGTMAGWFDGDSIEFPKFEKLLSTGDDCCEVVIKIKESNENDVQSPHATPGAFPPRIFKPVMVGKMATLMGLGMMKGVLKLMTTGVEPMEWYEHYRYVPEQF